MALLHRATLTPSKLDLLAAWVPGRPWSAGRVPVRQLGSYRFDDPAGLVGLESFLLEAADGTVLHVPLTYRAAPLAGAAAHLLGTMEHSVLGTRYVYDACVDPVYARALATAVLAGGTQAEELVDVDGALERREPSATVVGSGPADPGHPGATRADVPAPPEVPPEVDSREEGATTVVSARDLELVVVRVVANTAPPAGSTLTGRWAGGGPAVLAVVRRTPAA